MKLYITYLRLHWKRHYQHRLSFLFLIIGQMSFTSTSLLMIYFLMAKTPELFGYTRAEVLLSGAIINLSYALAECFARGFDQFGSFVRNGDFDRVIVRPVGEVQQIFMTTIDFTRFGRFLVALVTLIVVGQAYSLLIWMYFVFLVITGAMIYVCIFIMTGAVCFFTTENLEVFNILTDGSKEFGKIPYGFYGDNVLKFLTYIMPLALIQYYPLRVIFQKSTEGLLLAAPLFAYLLVIPTAKLWKWARYYYRSTGH